MSRTSFLVAIAAAVVLMQLIPAQANSIKWAAIVLGLFYLVVRAFLTYPKLFREKKRRLAQQAADDRAYLQYEAELNSIRLKYDLTKVPDDGTDAQELRDQLNALHTKYREMLDRKFGRGPSDPGIPAALQRQPIPTRDKGMNG